MSIYCPIPGCRREKFPDHYLCQRHWFRLHETTRKSLWLKDQFAGERLKLLFQAILKDHWQLEDVLIATDPATGKPRLWTISEAPPEVLCQ